MHSRASSEKTYDKASVDEQHKVSAGAKDWSGIKYEEDWTEAHEEQKKRTAAAVKDQSADAQRVADAEYKKQTLETAKAHAEAMSKIADQLNQKPKPAAQPTYDLGKPINQPESPDDGQPRVTL